MSELLPPTLPGERVVDDVLVESVVQSINRVHARRALELALEVGQIVVDIFFGGDLSLAEARAPGHVSYRALAAREDLAVSHSRLHKCVRVLVQVHQLGPEVAGRLTFSHHVALLPVRDLRDRQALARKAEAKGWTSDQLRTEAQKLHRKATGHRPGRPPLPEFMKRVRTVVRATRKATEQLPKRAEVADVDASQAQALMVELDAAMVELSALRKHVRAHLEALEPGV